MKKTYINPNMKVVTLNACQLMSGSPMSVNPGADNGSGKLVNDVAEGAAMGRGGWFDDEE